MSQIDDFHVLRRRVRFQGRLITRTGLRIGAGDPGLVATTDMAVLRDAAGLPLIPGSSLKGALRSTLEALVRAAGRRACDPLELDASKPDHACGAYDTDRHRSRDEVDVSTHCDLCRLFGSNLVASHVRFTDAHLIAHEGPAPVELRDGVAIHRDLRMARDGRKYDFEVTTPGCVFHLEVFIDNPEDWMLGLLAVGFDQLSDGFTAVGGFTSRGLGRVTLEWDELMQVDARGLLHGEPATVVPAEALAARFDQWRDALATYARGS